MGYDTGIEHAVGVTLFVDGLPLPGNVKVDGVVFEWSDAVDFSYKIDEIAEALGLEATACYYKPEAISKYVIGVRLSDKRSTDQAIGEATAKVALQLDSINTVFSAAFKPNDIQYEECVWISV